MAVTRSQRRAASKPSSASTSKSTSTSTLHATPTASRIPPAKPAPIDVGENFVADAEGLSSDHDFAADFAASYDGEIARHDTVGDAEQELDYYHTPASDHTSPFEARSPLSPPPTVPPDSLNSTPLASLTADTSLEDACASRPANRRADVTRAARNAKRIARRQRKNLRDRQEGPKKVKNALLRRHAGYLRIYTTLQLDELPFASNAYIGKRLEVPKGTPAKLVKVQTQGFRLLEWDGW